MPTYNELNRHFQQLEESTRLQWVFSSMVDYLSRIRTRRGNRNVILYGSGVLQKPNVPGGHISITLEDMHGFMAALHGMTWNENLTLILHTPGGLATAPQSIVEYLRSHFRDVEIIVPSLAQSAGTALALASDRIIMSKNAQLGPIDPQMPISGRFFSAQSIVEQFDRALASIKADPAAAAAWAPILAASGPALIQESQNNLALAEELAASWLGQYMFAGQADAGDRARAVAKYFNDNSIHKNHGRRIGISEARAQGLRVDALEDDQLLQEEVLSLYHLMTIAFEKSAMTKLVLAHTGANWIKNWAGTA